MDEKQRKEIALFRYSLIAPVLTGSVKNAMGYFREASLRVYNVASAGRRRFKPATFKTWLALYRRGGFDALMPAQRSDKGKCRIIDESLAALIASTVEEMPDASCAAIYRRLIAYGHIQPGSISEGTLRKFIKDSGLKKKPSSKTPRRKFEKEHFAQLWIADVMHGGYIRHEGKKRKTFLIAAIDDYTRMIPLWGWFFHENSTSLTMALKEGIRKFGLPQALYCDNGSIFVSSHLQIACARLGIVLIHSKPYDPPSRGKIERFFRTVRGNFLSGLDLREIKDLSQLNSQFARWLNKQYHKQFHHGIRSAPMDRFMADVKDISLKTITDEELDRSFEVTIHRRVKNDSTVSIKNILYECPPEFIGKKIQIRYPIDKPEALTIYENNSPIHSLHRVCVHQNASLPALGIHFAKEVPDDD